MSDLATILLLLAIFGLAAICAAVYVRRIHARIDDIVTGMVNGVAVPTRYRRFMLYQDFFGNAFGVALILIVFMAGFLAAAEAAAAPSVRTIAYYCAAAAGWGGLSIFAFSTSWVFFLVSILRQAESSE
ncbi:MAG: hypothetical protein JSW51_10970 [Gemmatimonadota bacterium]|nr:MAG: hypothetical protein JSW51_10970 [Gemmatimonadota bacterium]